MPTPSSLMAGGGLVDLDVVDAGVVEGEGEGHAADAAPDDGDLHVGFSFPHL